jgi:hypothetical protein
MAFTLAINMIYSGNKINILKEAKKSFKMNQFDEQDPEHEI